MMGFTFVSTANERRRYGTSFRRLGSASYAFSVIALLLDEYALSTS